MSVTKEMVKILINGLLQDCHGLNVSESARRVEGDFANRSAADKSNQKRDELYGAEQLHQLLERCQTLCGELQQQNIVPGDHLTTAHGWLKEYLPLFGSEYLDPLTDILSGQYYYTDQSEKHLLALAALLLSYHSGPTLLTEQPEEFKALSTVWLEALLTFNCISKPELARHIPGWHDRQFYSAHRNVLFMQYFISKKYLPVSRAFLALLPEWSLFAEKCEARIAALEAIDDILKPVMAGYKKINSTALRVAIDHLQSLKDQPAGDSDPEGVAAVSAAATFATIMGMFAAHSLQPGSAASASHTQARVEGREGEFFTCSPQ